MKLFYIANTHIPTGKAHGIQIMEMCQAFANLGHEVELLVRDSIGGVSGDPFEFYDITPNFKIKKLWCLNSLSLGRFGFWLESLTFAWSTFLFSSGKEGVFYTRDELLTFFLPKKQTVWEAHMGHENFLVRALVRRQTRTVVITEALKDLYRSLGLAEDKILVAPDGADIDRFNIAMTKEEARFKLSLPQEKKIILYKGSLIPWKGAGTFAEAASLIKTDDAIFVCIGGNPGEVTEFKAKYGSVPELLIVGKVHRSLTPIYQKAADVLVIPNSAKEDISKLYTSPLKLFGYMAGSVPIVASDLPSIREVLNEENAYFFSPDDPASLAEVVDEVLREYPKAEEKARLAFARVENHSWKKRAEEIINFIHD